MHCIASLNHTIIVSRKTASQDLFNYQHTIFSQQNYWTLHDVCSLFIKSVYHNFLIVKLMTKRRSRPCKVIKAGRKIYFIPAKYCIRWGRRTPRSISFEEWPNSLRLLSRNKHSLRKNSILALDHAYAFRISNFMLTNFLVMSLFLPCIPPDRDCRTENSGFWLLWCRHPGK